ncbi:DUF2637 domain-containing protein [Streptomyces bohaiensis]|uniref:DUF2637 domain-containing protein n=1 Tax=Streptomyces bohaiensis TaxID=1431344 RepID=A0ABX1C6F0_9ACTN|nr:DUF2637 domain-containing protein [Streptomyces bohaiensis]NJQ14751.1 DUF2637 domain-containing protein [Streptomyces bohaiensis]
MTLTDVHVNWVLGAAILLVGTLVAVVLLARGRQRAATAGDGAAEDSWERMEERRRRKERMYATASYTLLFCCAGVAAALSFHGLVGFGRENLNLSGGWEYLVPFGLDGAAMFCAVIAVREASHGDASVASRMLVWLFAGAAAWFNWVHAPRGEMHAGAPHFFAGMSLSAAILFDRALKQTRRAALREQGLVPRPLPQIRFVRWMRAPRETFGAWSLMLLEGVRTLDEAVDEVRDERRERETKKRREKEQRRLERSRNRALRRQHRMFGRGRVPRVEVAVGGAGSAPVGAAEAAPREPGQLPAARQAPGLSTAATAATSPAPEPKPRASVSGSGRAPLDTLEAKLAQIEKQFD